MSLQLIAKNLYSRSIRANLANGLTGVSLLTPNTSWIPVNKKRRIERLTKLAPRGGLEGLIEFLWNAGKGFAGWLFTIGRRFLEFSATAIWGTIVNLTTAIAAFDWNATDTALYNAIQARNTSLYSIWGSFIGAGLGWFTGLAVGAGVSLIVPVIGGAALSRFVLLKAGKEAVEELLPQLLNAIRMTVQLWTADRLTELYIDYRWVIKGLGKEALTAIYGPDTAHWILNFWGKEGGPNMSITQQIEESIEGIKDKNWRAFVDSANEEFWDSFIEAGFVVASTIDEAYAQSRQSSQTALGTARSLEIELDAKAETENSEKIKFVNLPQRQIIQSTQEVLNTYRLVHNRDIGMVMGLPLEEYTRAKPQSLRIVIDCYSRNQPPYWRKTDDLVWATITIPDCKREAVDWERIKAAAGGVNGYLWGRFKGVANLSTGRRLILYAGSESEARDRLMAMLALSDAEMLTINITEEVRIGERLKKPKLQKDATRVYPGYFTILNRKEILDQEQGRTSTRQKNFRDAKIRIPLWTQSAPENFNEMIAEIMSRGF